MAKATATIHIKDLPEVRNLMRQADERITQLETIVRSVAAIEPMAYCPGDEMSGDWYECGFCGVQADAISRHGEWGDVEHPESCEWRRAREWVDSNPA